MKIQNSIRQLAAKIQNFETGLGMVEMLVATAVIVVVLTAVLQVFQLQFRQEQSVREGQKAYALLAEAMEATRSVRDDNWMNVSGLTKGASYYPTISGNAWTLSLADPGPIDGYTRWIVVDSAQRNFDDDIVAAGGSIDPDTLKITGRIEWQSRGSTKSKVLVTYFTNWHGKL